MLDTIIHQQSSFLKDYREAALSTKETDSEILERLLSSLRSSESHTFTLHPSETKYGKKITFPFELQLQSRDYDGSITAEYTYIGEPFEEEEKSDEQQEW